MQTPVVWNDQQIVALRPAKDVVDVESPITYFAEQEPSAAGRLETVATIFLANRECSFRCLMCDLWKNTTNETVPLGAIPRQIELALAGLPPAQTVKLYNSGNFFDRRAVPSHDHGRIAELVKSFSKVIIENHPRLCSDDCRRFQQAIAPAQLEVAMGLETVHPQVLPALNKRMSLDDFKRATDYLIGIGAGVRSFLLLRPPFLSESEGVEWTVRSMEFAFSCGVECCSIVPSAAGTGPWSSCHGKAYFSPPH